MEELNILLNLKNTRSQSIEQNKMFYRCQSNVRIKINRLSSNFWTRLKDAPFSVYISQSLMR